MPAAYFDSFFKLFEHIFKNEIIQCSICVTWHSGEDKTIEWKDLETQKTVEENEELHEFVMNMLDMAIQHADNTGGHYGVTSAVKNNEFGFLIWSGYTEDMTNEMSPEGVADSNTFYSDDFIEKLKSYPLFKSINRDNLGDFVNFEIGEGYIDHFRLFDSVNNKWIDYDKTEIGEEVYGLFADLYGDCIYRNGEFNVINDKITFSETHVSYFTEEQTVLEDGEFVSISSILDYM